VFAAGAMQYPLKKFLLSLALLFLKVNDHGAAIALVFFGFYALLTGYLIVKRGPDVILRESNLVIGGFATYRLARKRGKETLERKFLAITLHKIGAIAIVRSTFLPRILGVLGIFAGLGWLSFLYRLLGYLLFPYIAALGLLGGASLILWLLVFGVNEQRWKEQASAAR
jgi:hypothetical protein